MSPINTGRNVYYASVIAKEPRKRKERRFEIKMEGSSHLEAVEKLNNMISRFKLRDVRGATMQAWNVDDSSPEITFRALFPSGAAMAVELTTKGLTA